MRDLYQALLTAHFFSLDHVFAHLVLWALCSESGITQVQSINVLDQRHHSTVSYIIPYVGSDFYGEWLLVLRLHRFNLSTWTSFLDAIVDFRNRISFHKMTRYWKNYRKESENTNWMVWKGLSMRESMREFWEKGGWEATLKGEMWRNSERKRLLGNSERESERNSEKIMVRVNSERRSNREYC